MAYPTETQWTDASWNPIGGCSLASPGCKNCYAQLLAGTKLTASRYPLYLGTTDWRRGRPVFNGNLTVLPPGHDSWVWPLKWRGADHPIMGAGQPSLIFVCDMADLFHEQRPTAIIDRVVGTIAASNHIGQILTKRAHLMAAYFAAERSPKTLRRYQQRLWLSFSAERQQEFDARWSHMRALAASSWTVFVGIAPMLAPVTLPPDFLAYGNRIQVICSGEQGPGARLMQPDWARALRDQCAAAGVPFFMKQMTGKKPIPPDLFVRQFPRLSVVEGLRAAPLPVRGPG